mmetsp:Transcript_87448/g.168351  ORF Transcript_87448/g.168351 Transcript_87448/m.168351 type:complete len:206 (+) Transcript_87448:69-686(+)
MYLNTVLQIFQSNRKKFTAEDLYKLNEAIFNLPEEDTIDKKMSASLFTAIKNVKKAYDTGRYDKGDPNFFYDFVALLSTMQNQHFFNQQQNKQMLDWLLEALGGAAEEPQPTKAKAGPSVATKSIAKLEAENEELEKQIEKMRAISDAVQVLKTFTLPSDTPSGKDRDRRKRGKGEGKGRNRNKKVDGGDGEGDAPTEAQAAPAA